MKIWIDIVNSPHVLFFQPIIHELKKRGHEVLITARDFAQTLGLVKHFKIPCKCIGTHAGRNRAKKILNVLDRATKLMKYIHKGNIDLAVSFNSPSQAVAARMLGVPSVTLMDYEYQPLNHLTFRLAQKVIVPTVFPDEALERFGVNSRKVSRYNGLKEQVYLSDFNPDFYFLDKLGIDKHRILVTVRPPATMALYHRFENLLFRRVLDYLSHKDFVTIVVLPRTKEQKTALENEDYLNVIIPKTAVDSRNLLYYSDLVIGAGGTMNREAVILGTPAYTIYKGKMGAVDKYLVELGRMVDLSKNEDLLLIKLEKKKGTPILQNRNLCQQIIDKILGICN